MVTNLAYFYESSKKVRGGKFVWVKDSNGEQRGNVLLGGTILNPRKGFDHLFAAQLAEYIPGVGVYIFRSFKIKEIVDDHTFTIENDGYSDIPEASERYTKNGVADGGELKQISSVTVDETTGDIVVAWGGPNGTAVAGDILVQVIYENGNTRQIVPNTFIEADHDLMPTEGYGIENANYSISTVYNKQAWIARMQPLPNYVLAKNRSYIDGIFWI